MPIAKSNTSRVQKVATPIVAEVQQAPISAFGGGQATSDVASAAIGVSRQVGEFAQQEIGEANKLAVNTFDNELASKRLEVESAAKQKKGVNAFNAVKEADEEFSKFASELQTRAQNDVQRAVLNEMVAKRKLQINQTVDSHTVREIETENFRQYEASSVLSQDAALEHSNEPTILAQDWNDYFQTQASEADRQGMSGDVRDAFMLQKMDQFHSKILNKMIAQEDYDAAAGYMFTANDDLKQMDQETVDSISDDIEAGQFRINNEVKASEIMLKDDNYFDRLESANAIDDKDERKEVTSIIMNNKRDEDAVFKAGQDALYTGALDILETKPNEPPSRALPVNMWNNMSTSTKNALNRIHKASLPESADGNNWDKWIKFNSLPTEEILNMNQNELETKYTSFFDKEKRKKALNQWADLRAKVAKGESVKDLFSTEQVIVQELEANDFIDPDRKVRTQDEKQLIDRFSQRFNRSLNQFEITNGREPNDDELRSLINQDILIEARQEGGGAEKLIEFSADEFEEAGLQFGEEKGQISRKMVQEIGARIRGAKPNLGVTSPEYTRLTRRLAFAFLIDDKQLARDLLAGRVK